MEPRNVRGAWPFCVFLLFLILHATASTSIASQFDPDSILSDPATKSHLQDIKNQSEAEEVFVDNLQKVVYVKTAVDFCQELSEGIYTEEIEKLMNVPVRKLNLAGWGRYDIVNVKEIVRINRTNPYIYQFKKIGGDLSKALSYYSLYKDIKAAIYNEDGARLKAISSSLEFSEDLLMEELGISPSVIATVGAKLISYSLQEFMDEAKAQYSDYWWNAYMQYLENKYPLIRGPNSWVELAKTKGTDGITQRLYEFWEDPYGNAATYYGKARLQTAPSLAERTKKDSYAASYYKQFIYPTLKTYFQKQAEKEEALAYEKAREKYASLMQLKKDMELLRRAVRQLAAQKENNAQEETGTSTGSTGSVAHDASGTEPGGSSSVLSSDNNPAQNNEKDVALRNADCSQWPGSVPVWNEAEKRAECECASGTQWNKDSTRCVTPREAALEAADCSDWPGSVPVWNHAQGRVDCQCPAGMQWNRDATQCIDSRQAAVEAKDCSHWPGAVAVWNPDAGEAECSCPSGSQWNNDHTKCIDSREAAVQNADCSEWPGSVPVWNEAAKRVECDCPGGYQWNEDGTKCLSVQREEQAAEEDMQPGGVDGSQEIDNTNVADNNCAGWDSAIMGQLNSGNTRGAWDLYFEAQTKGCVPSDAVTTALRNTNHRQPPGSVQQGYQQTYRQGQQYPYGNQGSYGNRQQAPYRGAQQGYAGGQGGGRYYGRSGANPTYTDHMNRLQRFTNRPVQGMNQRQYGNRGNGPGPQDYMNQIRSFTNSLGRMLQGMGVNRTRSSSRLGTGAANPFGNQRRLSDILSTNKNDPNYQRFMQINNQINRAAVSRTGQPIVRPISPPSHNSRTGNRGQTNTTRSTSNTNRGSAQGTRPGNSQPSFPSDGVTLLGVPSGPSVRETPQR